MRFTFTPHSLPDSHTVHRKSEGKRVNVVLLQPELEPPSGSPSGFQSVTDEADVSPPLGASLLPRPLTTVSVS